MCLLGEGEGEASQILIPLYSLVEGEGEASFLTIMLLPIDSD
jgi:hypothetical protein